LAADAAALLAAWPTESSHPAVVKKFVTPGFNHIIFEGI
jgi:hypothetical protein